MIRIELLPAAFGDSILVEYGSAAHPRRVLIDAGLTKTYPILRRRLETIGGGAPVDLELLVVTHIDRDHISGMLPLLEADPPLVNPKDIWFNGRNHLMEDELGPAEGEALSKLLLKKGLPWNLRFGKKAVVVPEAGELPVAPLEGARLTLLSPYRENLATLAAEWDDKLGAWDSEIALETDPDADGDLLGKRAPIREITVASMRRFAESKFKEDGAAPNGSSIAFLFEHAGKRILFGADAFPSVLLRSLDRYSQDEIELDAFKLAHHGSEKNTSPALLEKVRCARFLFSTNGDSFGHPNPETIARVVDATPNAKTLCFNYANDYTNVWQEPATRRAFAYEVEYPASEDGGFALEL